MSVVINVNEKTDAVAAIHKSFLPIERADIPNKSIGYVCAFNG